MIKMQWNDTEGLKALLLELVSWNSLTGTEGEQQFSHKLKEKLLSIDYFRDNPNKVHLTPAGEGRFSVTALYQTDKTARTIVLISHYDTVHIEEYGDVKHLAFQPEALTNALRLQKSSFSSEVQRDIDSGNYLFGRGIMDMKMGLALHMRLLEQATIEAWPINLMLVTVPDEEVNSAGMRTAVPSILQHKEQYQLDITLFLNSEPSFSKQPGDEQYYMYSGTIGKIMPSALFCGRETHAGEPLSGITGQYIASFLTQKMEWNDAFSESIFGETTPLPVTLSQMDLKDDYSTQTSSRTAALYNVFMMERNAKEVMDIFVDVAEEAATECNEAYKKIIAREGTNSVGEVKVITFENLLTYVKEKLTEEKMDMLMSNVSARTDLDKRDKTIRIVDAFMLECPELTPAMVLFFAPPYYPAVNTSNDTLIKEKVRFIQEEAETKFHLSIKQVHYFNGISDLSYVNYDKHDEGWKDYIQNMPTWGEVYNIPFSAMQQLQAPVLNIGPFGKDAHKVTERLHERSAFVETPWLVEQLIRRMF